jgi:hypothetical protein
VAIANPTLARFYQGSPLTETTLYTAAGGKTVLVKQIVIANTAASAATYSISIVASGGTAGATNRIIGGAVIAANDTATLDAFQVLGQGDFLSGIVSASTVVITASGVVTG